jgi:hypothetical protein
MARSSASSFGTDNALSETRNEFATELRTSANETIHRSSGRPDYRVGNDPFLRPILRACGVAVYSTGGALSCGALPLQECAQIVLKATSRRQKPAEQDGKEVSV